MQVRRALDWLSDRLASWPEQIDAVVDVGRVDPSLGHPMLGRADAIVVWTHTTAAGLGATASLLAGLDRVIRADAIVRVVAVGETPYSPTEAFEALAEFAASRLSIALGAALPNDARLASVLASGGRKAGRVCGSWFGRLAAEIATTTAYRTPPVVDVSAGLRTVQHVGGVR